MFFKVRKRVKSTSNSFFCLARKVIFMPKTKYQLMRHFVASLAFCLGLTIPAFAQYSLTVESADPVGDTTPGMVYRFYVHTDDASDKLSAVYGSDSSPLVINTPDGIFNSAATSGASAEGLTDFLLSFFPDTADDSYATVNLSGPASASGISGAAARR